MIFVRTFSSAHLKNKNKKNKRNFAHKLGREKN